jgi:hypothetical protein
MTTYIKLEFDSREDFIAYDKVVKLKPENVAYPLSPKKYKFIVLIKAELPIPKGVLHAETREGEEIKIAVSTCTIKDHPRDRVHKEEKGKEKENENS